MRVKGRKNIFNDCMLRQWIWTIDRSIEREWKEHIQHFKTLLSNYIRGGDINITILRFINRISKCVIIKHWIFYCPPKYRITLNENYRYELMRQSIKRCVCICVCERERERQREREDEYLWQPRFLDRGLDVLNILKNRETFGTMAGLR